MPPSPSQETTLPPRHILFIEAYCMGENATQAAIGAGYSPKTAHVQGSRMLRNVKVLSEIQDRMLNHRERCSINVDNLTAELEEARLLAMKANRPSSAVRATIAKAKLHRLL
jgi:phage terminase small subunit